MRRTPLPVALAALVLAVACAPADPRAELLEERARWKVEPLDWATTPDGAIQMTVRVSEPTGGSDLDELTFRIDLLDASAEEADSEWKTVDLAQVGPRGAHEYMLRLDPRPFGVAEIRVDPVTAPTPDEERHIVELD
jgi:hypothetical protein